VNNFEVKFIIEMDIGIDWIDDQFMAMDKLLN